MYAPLLEMVLESYTLYFYKYEKEGTIYKTQAYMEKQY